MPARTHAKKTSPAKKSSAKKPARAAKRAKRHSNGAMKKAQMFAAQAKRDHARSKGDQHAQQLREKDDLLVLGQQRISALELELEQARSGDRPAAALEVQLRELQARFTTQKVELEASRAETENLREAVAKSRTGEGGALRCPRCGNKMSDQLLEQVRADRCESCHGIFFDNGELERVIKRHDEARAAGKSWLSGIFGKKN